jgi:AraC-like DNA-binding protein
MESWDIVSPYTQTQALNRDLPENIDITKHNDYEILVGLKGVYPYYYNKACYSCNPGSIFLISPMIEHESYYSQASNKLAHLWIKVNEKYLLAAASDINNGKMKCFFRSKISYDNYVPGLKLYEIWSSLNGNKKNIQQNILKLKLALCHIFLAIIESKQLTINEYQDEIMECARDYIKSHFCQKISLSKLAAKMGYSKFHFARLFKEYHTVTFQEYINQYRLKETHRLLKENVSKKEIAFQLGFSSPSAFANWYSKYRKID